MSAPDLRLADLERQMAEMAGLVRKLAEREFSFEMTFQAGFAAGQDDIRRAMGQPVNGPAGRPGRDAARGHLRAVQGGLR
jgi:hypothetical protein